MRVALSVDSLEPQMSGIGRYTLELLRGLRSRTDITDLRYFKGQALIDDPDILLDFDAQSESGQGPHPLKIVRLWRRHRRLQAVRALDPYIIHSTNFFLPDWAQGGVATIHDLSVLRFPHTHPQARRDDHAVRFERTVARAGHLITSTQAVRGELIDGLGIAPDRITAVPLGVTLPTHPGNASIARQLHHVGLRTGAYTLCVSTIEPRKRIAELVDAYARLPSTVRSDFPLVLVGREGWLSDEIVTKIDDARRAGWLHWLGFAADDLLDALYFGARLFVYPSLYEGFGLPPLEAMAHGIPTIVSNDPSLVEISGPASMVVQPEDGDAFTSAISRGLDDTQWRESTMSEGRQLVRTLSWDATVEGTVNVYRRVQAMGGARRS